MKADKTSSDTVTCEFSISELAALGNCINEAMEALEDWEFQTRVGVERDEAKALLWAMRDAADDPTP